MLAQRCAVVVIGVVVVVETKVEIVVSVFVPPVVTRVSVRAISSHPLHVLSHSSTNSPHKPLAKIRWHCCNDNLLRLLAQSRSTFVAVVISTLESLTVVASAVLVGAAVVVPMLVAAMVVVMGLGEAYVVNVVAVVVIVVVLEVLVVGNVVAKVLVAVAAAVEATVTSVTVLMPDVMTELLEVVTVGLVVADVVMMAVVMGKVIVLEVFVVGRAAGRSVVAVVMLETSLVVVRLRNLVVVLVTPHPLHVLSHLSPTNSHKPFVKTL